MEGIRITNNEYGELQRKLSALAARVDMGALDFRQSMDLLQALKDNELVPLLQSGGIIVSEPIRVRVTYPGFAKILPELEKLAEASISDEWRRVLRPLPAKLSFKMQFAHFEHFCERQPSTQKAVALLAAAGYRPATATELFCASRKRDLRRFGEYLIALGRARSKESESLLRIATTSTFHDRVYSLHLKLQPYWPACYRFAVVKKSPP